jgi:hypothetical protein
MVGQVVVNTRVYPTEAAANSVVDVCDGYHIHKTRFFKVPPCSKKNW